MFEQITSIIKKCSGFGRSVVSERDGTGSSSRIIGLIAVIGIVGVLIAYFACLRSLPSAEQLYGLAALLTAGVGAYCANRFGPPPPPPQGGQE